MAHQLSRQQRRLWTYSGWPVQAQSLGPFDMHGNAWEWVEDCWTPIASQIPTDGSAFSRAGKCEMGVVRGGSFASGARRLRSATRLPTAVAAHYQNYGFRVALTIED